MLPFLRSDLVQFTAYTAHTEDDAASQQAASQPDHLDTNESPFDLPGDLKQKLAWAYQHEIAANRYPDGGHGKLKQTIADYVSESLNLPLEPAWISVGNGSDELIRSLLIATCLKGEGAILVAEPTFSMYAILAQTLGIPVVKVGRSATTFAIDLAAAQQALQETQNPPIRVVFVVHPNSPTGNGLTETEIDWLHSLSDNILVVIDEAYFEFSQQTLVAELAQHPNWMILRTFSKAFRLAAHRVGYAIGHPALIQTLEKVRLPYNLPTFSQSAAWVALSERQQLLEAIPLIQSERERLIAHLTTFAELEVWPSCANFVYLKLGQTMAPDLTSFCQQLKQLGTLVRCTGGGIRVTVGSVEENDRTLQNFRSVLDWFKGSV